MLPISRTRLLGFFQTAQTCCDCSSQPKIQQQVAHYLDQNSCHKTLVLSKGQAYLLHKELYNNRRKKYLVFINPASGKGKALEIFRRVQWMLQVSNVCWQLIMTEGKNHCKEYCKKYFEQSRTVEAILIFSGDGLVHECVNGVPLQKLRQVPVIQVPCGSGNALSATIADKSGLEPSPENLMLVALKGSPDQLNAMQLTLHQRNELSPRLSLVSFLSIEWGIILDIDKNSERLRFLGGFRFDVYGLFATLFRRRQLRARLVIDKRPAGPDSFSTLLINVLPHIRIGGCTAPLLKQMPLIQVQYLDSTNLKDVAQYMLHFQDGDLYDQESKKPSDKYNFGHELCREFSLEIDDKEMEVVMVDGQEIPCTKVQGALMQGVLRTLRWRQ